MKKVSFLLPIALFALANICTSQPYKYVYYLDKDLASTTKSTAIIIGKGFKENGLVQVDYFDRQDNLLFMIAHFTDSSLSSMMGLFTEFYKNNKVATRGDYLTGKKTGLWQQWDSLGHQTDSTIYQQGFAIQRAKFIYHNNGVLRDYAFKDSLQDTFTGFSYNDKNQLVTEVFFKGQSGILKKYEGTLIKTDSLNTREEKEAGFAGGKEAWTKFLQKNLNANIPVENRAPVGIYKVIVKFIVAIDGKVGEVIPETHYGYGMENEVVRIIKRAPAWEPATQYGRKVNAYRRQPITFIVEQH